jgi:hypothetical protein
MSDRAEVGGALMAHSDYFSEWPVTSHRVDSLDVLDTFVRSGMPTIDAAGGAR